MTSDSDDNFNYNFRPGQFYLFTGQRGSGKTTKAADAGVRALEQKDLRYAVLSNVVLKKRVDGVWQEAYPPHYFKVMSWYEVMKLLPDLLDGYDRIMFVIDEAVLSGQGAGMTSMQAEVRAVQGFATILRKARMSYILIVLDEQATMRNFRQVGRVISAIFRSTKNRWSEYSITTELGTFVVDGFEPRGFARPKERVPDGELVFDSVSSASFTHGRTPRGKQFDLMTALQAASNCIEEDLPQRLREHMDALSGSPPDTNEGIERSGRKLVKQRGDSTQKGIKPEVVRLLLQGETVRNVMRATGCSKTFAYATRDELKSEGR